MLHENPTIEWIEHAGRDCLKFTFHGALKSQNARGAIEKWKTAFQEKNGEKIPLIWDCHHMTGYDTDSRVEWQNTIKDLKKQIDSIWLITDSKLIRVGAQIMTVFTHMDIRVVQDESQIRLEHRTAELNV
ncbi:hypothetical protein JW948_18365 [bacterium]|nr:hypothetical protein [bacterium]